MPRMFRYIQNEDVLKTFRELNRTVLLERPIIIARYGDYSVFLKYVSDTRLELSVENTLKNHVAQTRTYDIDKTTNELVSRGVRHACQKMAELSDAEVNRKRLQIWKWYLLDWQEKNVNAPEEFFEKEKIWLDEDTDSQKELMDMESYLHGEYLNMGATLALIEKYLADDPEHLEQFKKFAVADIMEMTSEDTKDNSLAEAEKKRLESGMKKHTYRFTVSVEATDKEHARQALLSYLAGDDRIKIQK